MKLMEKRQEDSLSTERACVVKGVRVFENEGHSLLGIFFFFKGFACGIWRFPKLGVDSELQLLAYTTATAMPDLSRVCNLYCSSQQCRILNPLSEARDMNPHPHGS